MDGQQGGARLKVIAALASVYVLWSSTYLAIRIAIESIPPFMMAGLRFFVTGWVLYFILRLSGTRPPAARQWLAGGLIGALLLPIGNGGVVYAEQWVASSLAALGVATVPLWTILFSYVWKRRPSSIEWIGVLLGFAGVVILNLEGGLRAHPIGAVALIISTIGWSFGSAWGRELPLPEGLMNAAVQMISGGALFFVMSMAWGEPVPDAVSTRSILALLYLMIFGALVGFSAYTWLINNVRASLATSYAYVNPVFAVLLGVAAAGESISPAGYVAMLVIVGAVMLVVFGGSAAKGQRL